MSVIVKDSANLNNFLQSIEDKGLYIGRECDGCSSCPYLERMCKLPTKGFDGKVSHKRYAICAPKPEGFAYCETGW